jgi:hypothetical protein
MVDSEFAEPSSNAESRADLLVLVYEGIYHRLEIHHRAQGQVRPTRLGHVFDLVRAIVRRHCVSDNLELILQRAASPTRDRSPQPQSPGQSTVDSVGTLAELVSFCRLALWL